MSLIGDLLEEYGLQEHRTKFNDEEKPKIFNNAGGCCERCGKVELVFGHHKKWQKGAWEAHHVIPLNDGGPNTVDNGAALCWNCHQIVTHSEDELDDFAFYWYKEKGCSVDNIVAMLNEIRQRRVQRKLDKMRN